MGLNIGIIGCGNSARSLAFYLTSQGHLVWLYTRNPQKYERLIQSQSLQAKGKMEGKIKLAGITSDSEFFCNQVSVIFVATQASAYNEVARNFSSFLRPQIHTVILFSGKLLGCFDFKQGLESAKKDTIKILETDSIFASRIQQDDSIQIRGIKNWTLYGACSRTEALEYGKALNYFFPNLEPAKNLIQRGLTDFGAVAHAVISLANISRIDRGEDFYFYFEGLSLNTVCLLEAAEAEFSLLARAYGVELIPMKELLNRYYGCDTSSLFNAVRTVPNYRDSLGPKVINHRYLQEDVSCTLVPMLQLAEKSGLSLPLLNSIVNICSILANKDFVKEGRNLERLGFMKYSSSEIVSILES